MRMVCAAMGALIMVLEAGPAAAQVPPASVPTAPAQRNPVELLAPQTPPRLSPGIEPPPLVPQTGPGAVAQVRIGRISFTGNEALPDAALAEPVAGLAGATVSLARIEEARLGILRTYREAGYVFASVNAGLTPQPDGSADLVFAVVEGFVAEVKLDGDIGPAATQVLRFLNRLVGQRPVSTGAIERALLLASDIPGVTVRGTLRPLQTEPGALQLIAHVERRWFSGYFNLDNRGYRLVGPLQALLVVGANSFTEYGERTELALFGAQDSTQWFTQASVEAFLGGSGLRLRIYGGAGETRPSGSLREIGYYGYTTVAGISATYPLLRSRAANLYLSGSFDAFDGEIETGTAGRTRASRDAIRTFRFGSDGQLLERWLLPWLPAATTLGGLRLHQGIEALGATTNGYPLSGRSGNEDFGFTKLTAELQRTQPLFSPFDGAMVSIQGQLVGQWTDDVLPQAEKCYLGGSRLGRGFYAGQVTGDKCWGYGVELQLDIGYELPITPALGDNRFNSQFYVFRDFERAYENLSTDPDRRLSSWGGGVRTVVSDTVQIDLEGVHRETVRPDGAQADRLKETAFFFRTLIRF